MYFMRRRLFLGVRRCFCSSIAEKATRWTSRGKAGVLASGLGVGVAMCWAVAERPPNLETGSLYDAYGVRVSIPLRLGRVSAQTLCSACSESAFRASSDVDSSRMRQMTGDTLPECQDSNPGLRVEINFVSESEECQLLSDVDRILERYSSSSQSGGLHVEVVDTATKSTRTEDIILSRCTGRPEGGVKPAPWGYGSQLDTSKLPDSIRKAAERIQNLDGYKLGHLRDVSINKRTQGFFFTSPHVDPLTDGPHVFVLGLQSATVLTFSPQEVPLRQGEEAERHSFTDHDLDVLVKKRSLVGFTKEARYFWKHGIRGGMEVDLPGEGNCRLDFWGSLANVVKRSPTRTSIVFAFADA